MHSVISVCFKRRQGVAQDGVRAYMWFNLVENQGVNEAKKKRAKIAELITFFQITKAQKVSLDCKKKEYMGCECY